MPIFQLIYVSRALGGVSDEMLQDIKRAAQRNNPHLGVTGLLLSSRGHFFQILEGEPGAVATLFASIESDARHHDVRVVYFGSAGQRCCPDWTMGVFDLDAPAESIRADELWQELHHTEAAQAIQRDNLVSICEAFRESLRDAA